MRKGFSSAMAACLQQITPARLEDDLARLAIDETAPGCLITDKAAKLLQYLLSCKVRPSAAVLPSVHAVHDEARHMTPDEAVSRPVLHLYAHKNRMQLWR